VNPRLVEPFELLEDDFLPARPPRLQLVGPFAEIDPPPWALKCVTKIGGKRHPKRERVSTSFSTASVVPWQPHGFPLGPVPNPDAEEAYNRALGRRRRKQMARGQQTPSEAPIPAGNLIEDDYRFWKGFVLAESEKNDGQCRWCNTRCIGRDVMLAHHQKGYCKEHLLALYKYAIKSSKQRYCFACKRETQERKWGLPLCRRKMCVAKWKFTFVSYLPGFQHYRTWAVEKQIKDPQNGPFAGLPASGLDEDGDDDSFKGVAC